MKRDELKHLPFKKSIIYYKALNIRNIHVSYEANKIMTPLPPCLFLNITHPSIVFKAPMWFFYVASPDTQKYYPELPVSHS